MTTDYPVGGALADALGAVRELVGKWRNAWMDGYETGIARVDEATANRALAKAECADELEAALAQQPAAVFRNDGNTEADFIAHEANACTACGGSWHKADQQPAAVDEAMVVRYKAAMRNSIGKRPDDAIRDALTAALAQPGGSDNDQ